MFKASKIADQLRAQGVRVIGITAGGHVQLAHDHYVHIAKDYLSLVKTNADGKLSWIMWNGTVGTIAVYMHRIQDKYKRMPSVGKPPVIGLVRH